MTKYIVFDSVICFYSSEEEFVKPRKKINNECVGLGSRLSGVGLGSLGGNLLHVLILLRRFVATPIGADTPYCSDSASIPGRPWP